MAGIINKIRDRAGTVISIIIFALLAFFVSSSIGDFIYSGGLLSRDNTIGIIAGKKLTYQEFEARFEQYLQNQQQNSKEGIDDNARTQVMETTWESFVNDIIFDKQTEGTGLTVGGKEMYDLFAGPNPHPFVKQIFTQNNQPFDVNKVKQMLAQANTNPQLAAQLKELEDYLTRLRTQEKFSKAVANCIFVSKAEAGDLYLEDQKKISLQYFTVNFSAIPDSSITLTERDYQQYYDTHREEFRQKNLEVVMKYVVFPKKTTAEDTIAAKEYLEKIIPSFANTKSDSLFAAEKSRSERKPDYVFKYVAELDPNTANLVADVPEDSVIGPIQEANLFKLIKVADIQTDTTFNYKIKHILIRPKGATKADSAAAKKTADSLRTKVKAENFAELATKHSDDMRSKNNGGEVGWLVKGTYGLDFDKALQKFKPNDLTGVIQSNQGYHIVQVLDRNNKKIRLATIFRDIYPGENTLKKINQRAAQFAAQTGTGISIDSIALREGIDVRQSQPISPGTTLIPGLDGAKALINWAFKAKKGDFSNVESTDNAFVVAQVIQRHEKGYKALDDVKESIKSKVMAKAKAKIIIDKLANIDLANTPFDSLPAKYGPGGYGGKSDNVNFTNSSYIQGLGSDPILIGKISRMDSGQVSKPIIGTQGVYVVKITKVQQFQGEPDNKTLEQYRNQLTTTRRSTLQGRILNALKEHAEIEDFRYKFYN